MLLILCQNDSDRGTYVVHEYMRPLPTQTSVYEILVPYLRESQVKKLIKKQYGIITDYFERSDELEDGEEDDLKDKFDTALDLFSTLLCDREEFASAEDAESYF